MTEFLAQRGFVSVTHYGFKRVHFDVAIHRDGSRYYSIYLWKLAFYLAWIP